MFKTPKCVHISESVHNWEKCSTIEKQMVIIDGFIGLRQNVMQFAIWSRVSIVLKIFIWFEARLQILAIFICDLFIHNSMRYRIKKNLKFLWFLLRSQISVKSSPKLSLIETQIDSIYYREVLTTTDYNTLLMENITFSVILTMIKNYWFG